MNTFVADTIEQETSNALITPTTEAGAPIPLREAVHHALKNYFDQLGGQDPVELYNLVLKEVELPLMVKIMEFTKNNQSRAAILLGISRGTLRKKLKEYGML